MPPNHSISLGFSLAFLVVGGTICLPAPAFDATSIAAALKEEQCTHMICVPTMLHALLDHVASARTTFNGLRQVVVTGATVTPNHLRQIIYRLGAKRVGSVYGMTEGMSATAASTSDPETQVSGDNVLSGTAMRGVKLQVCAPESWDSVPIGEVGELVLSGPSLINGYIGDKDNEKFRTIDDAVYFRSEDQVIMHPGKNVTVIGRYKDIIIRGGENIAAASIEKGLNGVEGVNVSLGALFESFCLYRL